MKRTLLLVINLFLVVSVMAQTPEEMYQKGKSAYDQKDYSDAVAWFRKAAEQGLADAQVYLGVCYSQGLGCEQDEDKAILWFQKAAGQGDVWGQFNLGVCYQNKSEIGDEDQIKNALQSEYWYVLAAKQNHSRAQSVLASMYEVDCRVNGGNWFQACEKVEFWYRKAAENGDGYAQMWMGCDAFARQQYDEAVKWFAMAGKNGTRPFNSYYGGIVANPDALLGVCAFFKRSLFDSNDNGGIEPVVIEKDAAIYCSVSKDGKCGIVKLMRDGAHSILIPLEYARIDYCAADDIYPECFYAENEGSGYRRFDLSGKELSE